MRFYISTLFLMLGVSIAAEATNGVVFAPTPTLDESALIALPILIGIVAGWALHRRNKK